MTRLYTRSGFTNVMHACPECTIGRPREDCRVCIGTGNVTELELSRWQLNIYRQG